MCAADRTCSGPPPAFPAGCRGAAQGPGRGAPEGDGHGPTRSPHTAHTRRLNSTDLPPAEEKEGTDQTLGRKPATCWFLFVMWIKQNRYNVVHGALEVRLSLSKCLLAVGSYTGGKHEGRNQWKIK